MMEGWLSKSTKITSGSEGIKEIIDILKWYYAHLGGTVPLTKN